MRKEIFSKACKKALTSSVAALLLASAVSVTAFADNSSADALPTATDSGFVDGCIPSTDEEIKAYLATDAQVYDLDYIEDSDDGMYDTLVQVCKAAEIASSDSSLDLSSEFPTPSSQGIQGSCTAWATTYALKSHQEYVEHGWDFNNKTIYSPAYVYNQLTNGGSGIGIITAMNLLVKQGACSLNEMPYNQYNYTTKPNASQKDKASNFKNISCKTITGVDAVKARLRAGDGVVMSIWDTSDFTDNNTKRDNGIFDKVSDEDKEDWGKWDKFGFHALCIVGYDDNYKDINGDTVPSFKFMNSWGSTWGYSGFGYISYDLFESVYGADNTGYIMYDDTHQNTDKFFTSNPGYVKTTTDVRAYTDPSYYVASSSSDKYEHTISSGETLKIDSFIAASNGNQPCFKTSDGLYINASKEQLEAVTAGEVRNVFISGSNSNSVYSYNNSETSSIKFNTNNSTQYNNHNTLRIDYTVNQSDSYNGYAGAKVQADSTVSTSGAKGLGFWYMTPSGQNGTVAFCMQGSVNKKLVELPTTNGEWKYYSDSYSFNGSSISDIEMYVNGNESNCKTTPATGTMYIADLAVVSEGSTPVIEQKTYYSFSCQAASSSAGTATATIEDGKYAKGTYVTVAASAKSGYKFIGWSKSKNGDVFNTNATYSFNLTEDTALYAQFEEDETYYLSVVKGDGCQKISITTADNVSKEFEYAQYPAGMTTVEVVGESGYTFKGWYTNAIGIGDPLSTSTKYTFNLKGITTLYPIFVKDGETLYTVNVVKTEGYSRVALFAEGSNGLTFTSGTFKPGKSITLIAQSLSGYSFDGWYTNSSFSGTPVSTASAYTFTVNSDITLYPRFISDDSAYRTLTVECDEHGHTEGTASGKYLQGKYITVTAYADDGYEFTGWTKGKNGELVTDYYYYSFNLDEDTTLYAHFEKLPVYTLTVAQTEGLSYASIDGNKAYTATFEKGSNYGVDVFAYAKSGYKFAGWYTNSSFSGDPVETSYHYTFDILSDTTLYPKFVADNSKYYSLTVTSGNNGHTEGASSGNYVENANITLKAVPDSGYKFLGWIKDNEIIKDNETYTFTINQDTNIKAVFGSQYENYSYLAAYATEGGKVLNGEPGFYPCGAGISITAVADDGYTFKGWSYSKDGSIAFTGNNFISKLSSDTILYAIFEKTPVTQYSFTLETTNGGTVNGTQSGTYNEGTNVSLTTVPDSDYKFLGWTKDNEIIKDNETLSFTLNKDTKLKAWFGNKYINYPYLAAYATEGGKVLNGEPEFYPAGAGVSVTAVADDGYTFKGWSYSKDGDIAFTGNNYISKISSDTVLYAIFEKTENIVDTDMFIKGESNSIDSWTNANGGSYLNITSGSSDYLYNSHKTLKLEYNIETNDSYGGYAGRKVSLESTYSNKGTSNYDGIGFWYLTPSGFNGQVALCLQSSSAGLDDLVQLPATNGEWKYYFYETGKTNVSDMILYINGDKNGYTTTKTNGSVAAGTLYIADMKVAKK